MKFSIGHIRWVLPVLYVLVVISFVSLFLTDTEELFWYILFGLLFAAQLMFVFGTGTMELCRPIKRRRLLYPVVAASLMMTVLVAGFMLSLGGLLYLDENTWAPLAFYIIASISWIVWGFIFFVYSRPIEKYRVLKRLTITVLAGSLLELLISVPSHMIVMRRPGCLVGISTQMGIIAGLCVMLWAFGPGILLLFLRDRFQREMGAKKVRNVRTV